MDSLAYGHPNPQSAALNDAIDITPDPVEPERYEMPYIIGEDRDRDAMPRFVGPLASAAEHAILTGDPERVPALAKELGSITNTWSYRGYECVEVTADGRPLLICSTGIGGPSTAIVTEELARLGVRTLVRLGSCGALQPDVEPGDIVISSGCVRDEGTSGQYLPAEFPAAPHSSILVRLMNQAERSGLRHHVGITHCKDAFYAEYPAGFPLEEHWRSRWKALRTAGVLATEMEASALFAVAQVRGLKAGALFVVVNGEMPAADVIRRISDAARIAQLAMLQP